VTGVMRRFKNDDTDSISGFWDEMFENGMLDKLKKQVGRDDLMGVCGHMDEKEDDFLYMISVFSETGADPGEFTVIKAPAATWAVFRSEEFEQNPCGEEIPKLFTSAYKEWLPTSGYNKVEGNNDDIYDMEIYGVTDKGKYFEEVWLSVTKS